MSRASETSPQNRLSRICWQLRPIVVVRANFSVERTNLLSGAGISIDRALLLISDRADQSCELAARISTLCRCLAIGLHEDTNIVLRAATAIVIDVALTDGLVIGRVQYLLSRYRAPTAPVVAILRADTQLERVQAAAVGATNPVTSKWSALREATLEVLSEHASEPEARATCCRYDAALRRRMNAQPLADLAHRAI